jgi:Rieske Fe-S protein
MNEPIEPLSSEAKLKAPETAELTRRTLLMKLGFLLNGVVLAAIATPVIRYLLGPVRRKGDYNSWVALGPVGSFPEGQTRMATYKNPYSHPWDGGTATIPCWVRRLQQTEFQVFAINCAHLGCPVRWFPQSELFMCPCHGGVYYADGSRASGPPTRGLFQYQHKITGDILMINAGQMPTLSNQASLRQGKIPCPGTEKSTIG